MTHLAIERRGVAIATKGTTEWGIDNILKVNLRGGKFGAVLKGLCTIPMSLTLNTRVGDRKDQIRMTSTITSVVEKDQLQTYMAGEKLTCDCCGLCEAPYGGVSVLVKRFQWKEIRRQQRLTT